MLCMPLAFFVGALPVFVREGANWLDAKNLALAAWALGYMCLWWGVARLASGFGKPLRVARLWVGAAFLVVLVLPLPLLAGLTTSMEARGASFETPWKLYLLHPIAQANLKVDDLLVHAALMAIVGLLCAVATLRNARPALER